MTLPPPIVINLRSGSSYDEYIGLGSMWGNKWAYAGISKSGAIRAYERRLRILMEDAGWRVELKALSGKRLGCHCAPRPCHGDVLVKLFLEFWGPDGKMISGDSCAGSRNLEVGSCA